MYALGSEILVQCIVDVDCNSGLDAQGSCYICFARVVIEENQMAIKVF